MNSPASFSTISSLFEKEKKGGGGSFSPCVFDIQNMSRRARSPDSFLGREVRAPRGSKLKGYSSNFLVHVVREWLFEPLFSGSIQSPSFAAKLLASAARRKNDEGCWLQERFLAGGPLVARKVEDMRGWLEKMFLPAEEQRGRFSSFYAGKVLITFERGSELGWELMECSARAGYAPAICTMASRTMPLSLEWLERAVEKNEGRAFVMMAQMDYSKRFELLHRAALCEDLIGMRSVSLEYGDRLAPEEASRFAARFVLFSASSNLLIPGYYVRASKEGLIENFNLDQPFAIGRELEGYEQFWDAGTCLAERDLLCIEVYLTTIHNARRAALQTVAVLMEKEFPRDVAKLVAKMVFATRHETKVWFK